MSKQPSSLPAPKREAICWDFFFALAPEFNFNDGPKKNIGKLTKKQKTTAFRALTWDELDKNDIFESRSQAALTITRALALLDTAGRNPESILTVKLYLLMGRAALYLARQAHVDENLTQAPTGHDELMSKVSTTSTSLPRAMRDCILMAGQDSVNISLAMSRFAWLTVGQVANEKIPTGRPGMAEAWFLAFQVDLMLAEVEASLGQDEATRIRPKDRLGPFLDFSKQEIEAYGEELTSWKVYVPGQQLDANQDTSALCLADYWWGMTQRTAGGIAGRDCANALNNLQRYKQLATPTLRTSLWTQEHLLESHLHRMGAAALMSLDATTPASETRMRGMVETLRHIFPGTPFEPTEDFVRTLKYTGHPDDPHTKQWNITCQLGSFGIKHRTIITILDVSESSPWTGMVIDNKILEGDNVDSYTYPTARQCYDVLLKAMAGAGPETRCTVGPCRRPHVVAVSYRMRDCFPELKELLSRVDVDCALDSEESLRFACASNQTDFETGGEQQVEQTLVGQRVGIIDLQSRNELNGRVGRVIKFHQDQERWEVDLERIVSGEKKMKIAVKPMNVISCPLHFANQTEYLLYRDWIRGGSSGCDGPRAKKTDDASVQALLDKLRTQGEVSDDSVVCAICQDSETGMTLLPCGHAFHLLNCLLPWIQLEKVECPVCRKKF